MLYTHFTGEVTLADAQIWFTQLSSLSRERAPIVVIVDLARAAAVDGAACAVLADATRLKQVRAIIYITPSAQLFEAVRTVSLLGAPHCVYTAATREDAEALERKLRRQAIETASA